MSCFPPVPECREEQRLTALCDHSQLENNNQVVSDQGVRKTLYQKVR